MKVIIRSAALHLDPLNRLKPINSFMSIFRNQQAVFLPCMTTGEYPSLWTIVMADPSAKTGDAVRPGDQIRLCWKFSDQRSGWRDFLDDSFGRRCHTKPRELAEVLWMKFPYPSFQNHAEPDHRGLIMSDSGSTDPLVGEIQTIPGKRTINFHDVVFRLDEAGKPCFRCTLVSVA
jgi:hypothetical protein